MTVVILYHAFRHYQWYNTKPDFFNKIVFITGASSGIGEELAKAMIKLRAKKVIIAARRLNELERVKSECEFKKIEQDGQSYQQTMDVVQLDLGDPDACLKFAEGFSKSNHVDILVNNGGMSQRDEFVNSDFCIAQRLMNVNTLSTIALTKGFLPQLIKLKDKGGA